MKKEFICCPCCGWSRPRVLTGGYARQRGKTVDALKGETVSGPAEVDTRPLLDVRQCDGGRGKGGFPRLSMESLTLAEAIEKRPDLLPIILAFKKRMVQFLEILESHHL